MGRLLIATANPGKLAEFRLILEPLGITAVTPGEIGLTDKPEETGETFAENSLLKANFYWQRAQLPVLADDGGLEIDALGGEPGVHSRRISGIERTDEELNRIILEAVTKLPEEKRTARLKIILTLRINADMNFQAEGSIEGRIRPSGLRPEPGYPYRAIFWVPGIGKFYKDFTAEEIRTHSHRAQAIAKLMPQIKQYIL